MTDSALLPCPFCNSPAELLDGVSSTSIRCSSDQCISRPEPFNDWAHKSDAIKAWNTRAPSGYVMVPVEPTEEMIEAGEKAYANGFARKHFMREGDTLGETVAAYVYKAMLAAGRG